jgi:endoribonuclease Dicer
MTHNYRCADYCLKSAEVPAVEGETPRVFAAVMVHSQSIASAVASSSRYAKVRASTRALTVIDGMSLSEFREKYHCVCQGGQVAVDHANIGTAV